MQYNVAQLLKEPTGAIRLYELSEELSGLDPELDVLGPLVGALQLIRTNSGVLVLGDLSTAVRATCNRCLEPIVLPVRFRLAENFRPLTEVETGRYLRPDEYEGDAEDLEDEALLINEQHILNISENVRQNIWLALPMYPGCNWEGSGECPNLAKIVPDEVADVRLLRDDEPVEPDSQEVDPRWAALLKLQGKLDQEKK